MKLAIIDYGMGNIASISGAIRYIGKYSVSITKDETEIENADKIILPGVGHFSTAMQHIRESGLVDILSEQALARGKPILGICLGMQLLGLSSAEGGEQQGLGLIEGTVDRFIDSGLKIPHIGFNQIFPREGSRLFRGLGEQADFYFVHSYRMSSDADIGQTPCTYGERFIAAFERDNIAGVQFHPELSQRNGLSLIENFLELY